MDTELSNRLPSGGDAGRPLLILDLDETLIHGTEEPLARPGDLQIGPFHVYLRPHAELFLVSVSEWYDTAVWSSASPAYVRAVVKRLFVEAPAPRFVWSSERCTMRLHPETGEHYWLKDLKKVRRAGYRLERVLALDDSPEKLARHYGNLVRVRPFTGSEDDTELTRLLRFLEQIRHQPNFRRVEKRFWRT